MKKFDFTEELAEYVADNNIQHNEEILVSLDGRDICKATVVRHFDQPEFIEFKVKALR